MQDSCAWKNVYVQKEDLKHKQAQVIFHVNFILDLDFTWFTWFTDT